MVVSGPPVHGQPFATRWRSHCDVSRAQRRLIARTPLSPLELRNFTQLLVGITRPLDRSIATDNSALTQIGKERRSRKATTKQRNTANKEGRTESKSNKRGKKQSNLSSNQARMKDTMQEARQQESKQARKQESKQEKKIRRKQAGKKTMQARQQK